MKTIVFLHPSHWEQAMGGAELQIFCLAKFLQDNCYDVHFIFENRSGLIKNKDNFILHPIDRIPFKKHLGSIWFLYRTKINTLLDFINPDFIYTRGALSWSGIASIYVRKKKIKHIWAIASDRNLSINFNKKMLLRPFDIVEYEFLKVAFKESSHILTQNNYQNGMLFKRYKRNGIKISQLGTIESDKRIVKPENIVNILWIGNLKPIKRPDLFLKLVQEQKSNINHQFYMVGKISSKYEKLISEVSKETTSFQFLGELPLEEVNMLLEKSHILINTSDAEGFSNTFVQAWMRNVVVLSINSNPDQIITKNRIGFIESDYKMINQRLDWLFKNKLELSKKGEKSRNYAIKNHDAGIILPKIKSILEKNL